MTPRLFSSSLFLLIKITFIFISLIQLNVEKRRPNFDKYLLFSSKSTSDHVLFYVETNYIMYIEHWSSDVKCSLWIIITWISVSSPVKLNYNLEESREQSENCLVHRFFLLSSLNFEHWQIYLLQYSLNTNIHFEYDPNSPPKSYFINFLKYSV